jgi:serine/threonine protein kinase
VKEPPPYGLHPLHIVVAASATEAKKVARFTILVIVLHPTSFSSIVVGHGDLRPSSKSVVRSAPQRSRHLAPGDKLGKYELIRQIAVGGMAELYLARTLGIEGFEKLVVVKRILPQNLSNANFVDMFLNEARLAATLHHPNIAQVYDIGVEEGDYFFAMEYVHGEDLDRIASTSHENGVPLSFDAALTLIAGMCAGLHYAHEKLGPDGKPLDVVHRDVSPSNILVSYDGAVKVVDFGIARAASRSTKTQGGLKGKIAYMSPEQCRAKTTLDRRSDIFSIGMILYELTTGQLPFSGESEYAVLNQIVNDDVPPPSQIVPEYPPALEKIVLRALARDPDQRYPTAVLLQQHIEDFAHENRLRVSPLVLARLMSTLFPARLEEWDQAKTQGAFFVEQHVVRTLIESGRTSDNAAAFTGEPPDNADTAVAPPPIMSDTNRYAAPAGRIPSLPGRVPFGTPPAAVHAPPTPPSQMPRATPPRTAAPPAPIPVPAPAVRTTPSAARAPTPPPRATTPPPSGPPSRPTPAPALPTPVPGALRARSPTAPRTTPVTGMPGAVPIVSITQQMPGTLISSHGMPDAVVQHRAPAQIDVTERVRIPARLRSDTSYVKARKRIPVIPIAAAGAVALGVVMFVALRGNGSAKRPAFDTQSESSPGKVPAIEDDKPVVEEPAVKAPPVVDDSPKKTAAAEDKVVPVDEPPVPPKALARKVDPPRVAPPKVAPPKLDDTPKAPLVRPKVVKSAKPRPKPPETPPKTETKEQQWNADSPFLPVRADKH